MVDQKSSLFRKESVERLSSPERLDQLMQIVNPKSWLPLASLGLLVMSGVIWSVLGRIPVTVEGQGVLIYPRTVMPIQSKGAGQLTSLNVKVGDLIKKGDILATVDEVDLRKQLQQQRSKLSQLSEQDRQSSDLQSKRRELDKKAQELQRQTLQRNLEILQASIPILKEKGLMVFQGNHQNLQQNLLAVSELTPILKQRWEKRKDLRKEGAIGDDTVLEARQQYLDNLTKLADAKSQITQMDFKEVSARQEYLENLNKIKDYQAQIQDLDSKSATSVQQDHEKSSNRKQEIQDLKRDIAKLEVQLSNDGQIISPHSGRVLEVTVNPGDVVSAGNRLATIEAEETNSKLVGVTYFPIGDGKKIQRGMTVQITPQTVKRERFGGIVGTVTNISAFPITKEAATSLVGNPDVVTGLVSDKQQGVMQISAELEPDSTTFSGYKWSSSKGPGQKISPGTTTSVRVKVEERTPITYIIPILRSYSGIF